MRKLLYVQVLVLWTASAQNSLNTAQIARLVSPSVVVIDGDTDSGRIVGSGFLVSRDGKLVTNLHVIRDLERASVHVANREASGQVSVLAIDKGRDLAIIQIPGANLPALELSNSNAVTVGERVVVVGSPRGLDGTVTAGIRRRIG